MVRNGGIISNDEILFIISLGVSLLSGLLGTDSDGFAIVLHRAFLVLTVVFGFCITWQMLIK